MGLVLGRSCKVLCGPQIRTPAAPLAFPSRPMPPDEPSCPWTAVPRLSCCCTLHISENAIHFSLLSVWAFAVDLLKFTCIIQVLFVLRHGGDAA